MLTALIAPMIMGATSTLHKTAAGPTLKIVDIVKGKGPAAKKGDVVSVDYTGKLPNGKVFDSSIPRHQQFVYQLGVSQVIKGWHIGVIGMKVGGKRKLIIPPDLGYGANGTPDGTIPPNATLIFEITLHKINGGLKPSF